MSPRKSPPTKALLRVGVPALLVLAVSQAARADSPNTTFSVTISGSTAFSSFFLSPGSTNDWIDINNDGIAGYYSGGNAVGTNSAGTYVQQLAPPVNITNSGSTLTYTTGINLSGANTVPFLSVQYRGTGSVNGLNELVNYALNGTLPASGTAGAFGNPSYLNRNTVSTGGGSSYYGTGGFPSAAPLTSIDAAVMDVTIPWGVVGTGSASNAAWNKKPTQQGYGLNNIVPINGTTQTNQLASLTSGNKSLNLNTASPNSNTVFGTPIAFAPISIASNYGTGLTQVTQTQLQFLYVTGRMANGMNLVAATRDIGSGTRNGAMNSVGVDPSFGVGDNTGSITNVALPAGSQDVLGPDFQASNLDSTGTMATVLTNDRLSVGYVSVNRGVGDQASGAYNVLGVKFDLEGGTDYVRPTGSTIVNNGTDGVAGTGYRIGGIETFATVGDPLANSAIYGNYGPESGHGSNPTMSNAAAAAYIRNIYDSVQQYDTAPTSTTSLFSPAQTLLSGTAGVPITALKFTQSAGDATVWGGNLTFNSTSNADAAADPSGHYLTGAYGSGANTYGVVPHRLLLSGTNSYSDGQIQSYRYYDNSNGTNQAMYTVAGGTTLNQRNAIEGNFSGNDATTCNIGDIPQMMAAVANPTAWTKANNSGAVGSGLGNAAIPEILGDFNGDGNFDSKDVRYFADGLALQTSGANAGHVDRKAAFTAVDTASSSNYFGTTFTVSNGTGGTFITKAYHAGDSRGDIAGAYSAATLANSPIAGSALSGADNVINAKDIDYEIAQIKAATGYSSVVPVGTADANGTADSMGQYSTLLTRAITTPSVKVTADFSADMNGDGNINADDLTELVTNILDTKPGDANLDGKVDGADYVVWANNYNQHGGGWAAGDYNGDGVVDGADYVLWANNYGFVSPDYSGYSSSAAPAFGPATAPTPEPASLAMVALGVTALLARRRKARS